MKLCISAGGSSIDAVTDSSFGRAPWLLIVDTKQNALQEAIENSGVNASQGAGIAAAQSIADKGAQVLLTGRVGPKAQTALKAAGIAVFENIGSCTVREALDQFNAGKYVQSSSGAAESSSGCRSGIGGNRGRGSGMGRDRRGRGGV